MKEPIPFMWICKKCESQIWKMDISNRSSAFCEQLSKLAKAKNPDRCSYYDAIRSSRHGCRVRTRVPCACWSKPSQNAGFCRSLDLKFLNFPGRVWPPDPTPNVLKHYKTKTRGFKVKFYPGPQMSLGDPVHCCRSLKMHYGSLWPRASHDVLSAESCLAPPPPPAQRIVFGLPLGKGIYKNTGEHRSLSTS